MATAEQYTVSTVIPSEQLGGSRYRTFLLKLFNHKTESDYPYNKRIFVSLCQPVTASLGSYTGEDAVYDPPGYSGSAFIKPLRTTLTGSFAQSSATDISGILNTNNLAELSTFEVIGMDKIEVIGTSNNRLGLIPAAKFELKQQYVNKTNAGYGNHAPDLTNFISGSYLISMCTDDNPSLLLELNKTQQLPGSIGDKEFVIIPENLHPFIKDNLLYFLTQAGVNVGGDTSNLIKIDYTHRNLP